MVKEYSLPLSAGTLLLTVPSLNGPMPEAALRLDTAYSALTAVAATLSEQELTFAMTNYHTETGMRISDLYETLSEAAPWIRLNIATPPVRSQEYSAYLTALSDLLAQSRSYERIILFVPELDDPLTAVLSAAPHPERMTVFSVAAPHEADFGGDSSLPFACVPVAMQEPVHPALRVPREEDLPDYDAEELFEGGAAS